MAMAASFSGCQLRTVAGDRGVLTWEAISRAIAPRLYYRAQTALVCIENTHNMAGGTVTPVAVMREICEGAHAAGLLVHLDGARIFNASAALGVSVEELTEGCDTVMFCLSKGLGAPAGSMLVGSRAAMEQARIYRKALGGGMRQAGVLAAAGLIALHEMTARLVDDHANARLLAEAVAAEPGAEIDLAAVQTNIVIFRLVGGADAAAFCGRLKQKGVLASAIGPDSIRFVTHYDADRDACSRAADITRELLRSP
jgi:threonine aldolase